MPFSPISVRLDPETLALIERMASQSKQSRSWVVREAVARYAADAEPTETAFDAFKPYIGIVSSGGKERLSEQTGRKVRELLLERRGGRASRSR